MNDEREKKQAADEPVFVRRIGAKAARKLQSQHAQRDITRSIWSGLGMIGLVGWAVAVPTVLGVVLGLWMDRHYPVRHSWTLTLLFIGLIAGCLNAWHWVAREDKETHEEGERRRER